MVEVIDCVGKGVQFESSNMMWVLAMSFNILVEEEWVRMLMRRVSLFSHYKKWENLHISSRVNSKRVILHFLVYFFLEYVFNQY